jgi:hypothetical protein
LYLTAVKPEIKEKNPGLGAGSVAKLATEQWNVATEEDKQVNHSVVLSHLDCRVDIFVEIQRHIRRELQKVLH